MLSLSVIQVLVFFGIVHGTDYGRVKNQARVQQYSGQMEKDDKYRKSLSDIGEEGKIQYDKIALEDHFYTATREERSRT